MELIFLAEYQKWFAYEAQVLIPYISNGPLIFGLYSVFGIRGASWFRGASNGCSAPSSPGILEQALRQSWGYRVDCHVCRDSLVIRSCRMAGTRLPAFPRWPATFRS